jgi:hypothetical protein
VIAAVALVTTLTFVALAGVLLVLALLLVSAVLLCCVARVFFLWLFLHLVLVSSFV